MTINSLIDALRELLILIPAILLAITVHEYFQCLLALKLGDPTPKDNGYLKFNPFLFIDTLGFINFIIFRFGWAKHISFDSRNFSRPALHSVYVILIGMAMNFITAILFILLINLYAPNPKGIIYNLFMLIIQINLNYFFLNFIPLLPLDAGRLLTIIYPKYQKFEIIGIILLLIMFIFNFTHFINSIVNTLLGIFIFVRSY